eukprot:scaffold3352_cov326-Prasinococcus_capsulatus_cf.AAC.4
MIDYGPMRVQVPAGHTHHSTAPHPPAIHTLRQRRHPHVWVGASGLHAHPCDARAPPGEGGPARVHACDLTHTSSKRRGLLRALADVGAPRRAAARGRPPRERQRTRFWSRIREPPCTGTAAL